MQETTAKIFTAPSKEFYNIEYASMHYVFLAGAIDQGIAPKWQKKFYEKLQNEEAIFLNPRRDSWDKNVSDDVVIEQIEWELEAMEYADIVSVYIPKNAKAPITLLEIGLNAKEKDKMVVCCEKGYYRFLNVKITCEKYGVQFVESFDELVEETKKRIER